MNTPMPHPADLQMLLEHQQLGERALRLYSLLVDNYALIHMPAECIHIIEELNNIVTTGSPEGINENTFDLNALPFID